MLVYKLKRKLIMNCIKKFLRDEESMSSIEVTMRAVLIPLGIIVAMTAIVTKLTGASVKLKG